jgi:hypothetical protein
LAACTGPAALHEKLADRTICRHIAMFETAIITSQIRSLRNLIILPTDLGDISASALTIFGAMTLIAT